jgi:L-alanine-DL-glutamate epimerase-like enolase superfamily enzyme
VHLVAATPNATYVEFFPDSEVLNFSELADTQLEVRDGELVLPTGEGLGFQWDDDAVDRYSLDGWE